MGQKPCGKCGEIVDEAKAFCPGCGNSLVDEKQRTSVSEFDRSNPTVQLGATMFNQMLSDMGLSVPKEGEKRVEVIAPAVQTPAAKIPSSSPTPARVQSTAPSGYRTWIMAGVIAILLFIAAALIVVVAAFLYFRQTA